MRILRESIMNDHNRNTEYLLKQLHTGTLDSYMKKDVPPPPFHEYIVRMCAERNETRAHIIKCAGINRTYGHQLFNGTRMPSRDKVIQLAFGFGLNLDQTQELLDVSRNGRLVPQIRRDAAILYAVLHEFDIEQTQGLLESYGMQTLGS